MNQETVNVIKGQSYTTKSGELIPFTSTIDIGEAEFMSSLIKKYHPLRTIEIGCAEGASTLAILDSISGWTAHHNIIDPFQSTQWKNAGIKLIRDFGYSNYTLIEKKSEFALPQLLEKNEKFDFALIDGYHTFDHTLLDAFYLIRMLNIGGVLVIDDVQMPAVNKCIRYLHNYPCLKYIGSSKSAEPTSARKMFNLVKRSVSALSRILPSRMRSELLDGSVVKGDQQLGLITTMYAFEKIKEDEREWNWWRPF